MTGRPCPECGGRMATVLFAPGARLPTAGRASPSERLYGVPVGARCDDCGASEAWG